MTGDALVCEPPLNPELLALSHIGKQVASVLLRLSTADVDGFTLQVDESLVRLDETRESRRWTLDLWNSSWSSGLSLPGCAARSTLPLIP